MKKRLSLFVMTFIAVLAAQAQMIAYSVTANVVGEPGEPTVVDLQGTTGTELSKTIFDADGNIEFNSAEDLTGFPIGFEFRFNSQKMTHFLIGGDGEIQLSPTEKITTDIHKNAMSFFTQNGIHDAFGIVTRQGFYGLDDTEISYWLEGVEGTRALCIQYKNVDFQTSFGADEDYCGAKATILYRLYEKSGNIEMKVNGFKPAQTGNYNFMRIGILGDSNDFVQVQSWDGSVFSARDNSISYTVDSYPQDGTVYTFVAPEPCVTPTVAPTDLVLSSTTTQISGSFTASQGDHYLVLATTGEALSERPAAGTKYAVGDVLGNAIVIANVDRNEFVSPNNMEQGTWHVFVVAYNSLCMDGPLYCAESAQAVVVMKPQAPKSLTVTAAERNMLKFAAEDAGATIVVAMTDVQYVNPYNQALDYGVFGEPAGNLETGSEIEGGGKVVYVGSTTDGIELGDLTPGKAYFLRAWSADGNGGYSSEYLDVNAVTAAELPWTFDLSTVPVGGVPLGWSENETDAGIWSMNSNAGYVYNQVNAASAEEPAECWWQSHDIYLDENSNWLSIDIACTEVPWRFASDWTMLEGDEVAVQLTTDGVEYKNILTLNKDNMPAVVDEESGETTNYWQNGVFSSFKANFSEYAGQKVKLRLYVKRQSNGQVQFKNLKLDGTLYGIVGNIPGMTWDDDVFMTQSATDKNVYEAKFDVTIDEVPAEAYEYKLRTNQNWDGYQLPAEGNQSWMPAEAGDFTLVFTANVASHTLSLSVQRPFEVTFGNEGNWTEVYAYTWSVNDDGSVTEFSGAWPGTKVEASGSFWSRTFTYNFTAEKQPQYIIWSNGGGNEYEEAEQTEDLAFVNHKTYSYYPEIVSVQISGAFNSDGTWKTIDMEKVEDYGSVYYQATLDLSGQTGGKEFKLVINGGGDESDNWAGWLGYGNVDVVADEGWVTDADHDGNLLLNHDDTGYSTYTVVAQWMGDKLYYNNWTVFFEGDVATNVDGVRQNAQRKTIYNLGGQRLSERQRGVNIVDGKKVAVK